MSRHEILIRQTYTARCTCGWTQTEAEMSHVQHAVELHNFITAPISHEAAVVTKEMIDATRQDE